MRISTVEVEVPVAEDVKVTEDTLSVDLSDGRTISVPLAWFPRLVHGTRKERDHWRLIGKGHGIHWEDLDEDVSVENLLRGHASGGKSAVLQEMVVVETAARGNRREAAADAAGVDGGAGS